MKYNREIALRLQQEFDKRKIVYAKMGKYYKGETDAFEQYPITDRSNRKVKTNHIKMFIDEEVAYLTGNKLTYLCESDANITSVIEYNLNNINSCLDTDLATTLLTYGTAYELYYLYEGEFKAKVINPLQGIAYRNVEGKAELFLYFYTKELEDNKYYIDCFDDKYIYHFDENFNEIKPPTQHYFGICPVGVAELNNGAADTIYNSIKDLQDSYESTLSDWSNEIADTRLAYMLITGMALDDEDAKKMKSMGILQCPDPAGKIEWLVKNIASDFIKSYREILEEEMYKVTHHLKNQVAVQSNTSGAMLATRLNCLRIKLTTIHQCLNNCIKTRLRCLFKYLNTLKDTDYNYKDVSIKFTLNLPNNDLEMAQILSQLTGKLSIRTGLSQLSFVTNAEEEYNKMMEEQEQALGELDLDVIKDETEQISA